MTVVDILDKYIDVGSLGDLETIQQSISPLSNDKLSELIHELQVNLPQPGFAKSKYRYIGNSELSGLPYPCGQYKCRSRNVSEISAFGAMYADEVILFNPLSQLSDPPSKKKIAKRRSYVNNASFVLSQLIAMRSLISRGIVTFIDLSSHNYCIDCFNKGLRFALDSGKAIKSEHDLFFYLINSYLDRVNVVFVGKQGRFARFDLSGEQGILGHPSAGFMCEINDTIKALVPGQVLAKEQVIEIGIPFAFAHYSTNDFVHGYSAAVRHDVPGLMSNLSQYQALKEYFGPESFGRIIDTSYPFLSGLDIDQVLKIRDQEWHHFDEFRTLIDAGISSGADVMGEMKAETAKIEKLVEKNARLFSKEITKEIWVGLAGLGASVMSAGLSGTVALVLGAISSGHLAKTMIPKLIDRFSEPEEARSSKMYYAWKVARKARRTVE